MGAVLRAILVLLPALLAGACTRGPEDAELSRDVQARLDAVFGRPVLQLRTLKRQGSAPFAAARDGAKQAIVYYNATLDFTEAYHPSDWDGLSPQLIASALGATDQGVVGLESGSMAPGSELKAYGSLVYRREGVAWRATDLSVQPPSPGRAPPTATSSSVTDELVRRLVKVVDTSPGTRQTKDRVVEEELDHALQNIQLRLGLGADRILVATGPRDGEYARFVDSIRARFGDPDSLNVANTEGSVANAFLVDRGRSRFGIVQSDVAAAAVTGAGLFATTGPLRHLRAVASLFPEPLHVVVRADSGIESVAQLEGRRVTLGAAGSGTRYTAVQVLAVHGLSAGRYAEANAADSGDALEQLAAGSVDAVVEVISAPWSRLAQVSHRVPLRVLPLEETAIERSAAGLHGLVPLAIPARTYPGQEQPVRSLAATALLVANSEVPDAGVASMLDAMFAASAAPGLGVSAARLSRERALVGVTIPLHEGAARFFESASGRN
jgi:TRAP transporter TAXI family solute receptor